MNKSLVEVNGISLSYIDEGEGHPLLFCHGFPETSYSWRHQIRYFANKGYRVIAVDMPGYGGSTVPARADRLSAIKVVGDLVALMRYLNIDDATIIGNDWGSTIAWQAALMRPDVFSAIVAMGVPFMARAPLPPTSLFPSNDKELFYTLYFQTAGLAEKEFEEDVSKTIEKIYFAASGEAGKRLPGDNTPNPFSMVNRKDGLLAALPEAGLMPWLSNEDKGVFVEAFSKTGFFGALSYYRNLDTNWENEAAFDGSSVTVPALFLVGERDTGLSIPGMDEIIDSMDIFVPHLQGKHIISESGHWLPQEKPEEVNSYIEAFLDKARA